MEESDAPFSFLPSTVAPARLYGLKELDDFSGNDTNYNPHRIALGVLATRYLNEV